MQESVEEQISKSIGGIVFDLDGVLFDTAKYHEMAWIECAQRLGKPISHDMFVQGFGLKNESFIKDVLQWSKDNSEIRYIISTKEKLFQQRVKIETIPCFPGVEAWIQTLLSYKIPLAIGSSSVLENINLLLEKSPIKNAFTAVISGENVHKGKPDPEVFIKACKALGQDPCRCVVFEDAISGIASAKNAHAKAVAVTNTFSKDEFLQANFQPDLIIESFSNLSIYTILSIFKAS